MESTAAQFSRLMGMFIEQEASYGITSAPNSEQGKLARLSPLQFQELATDVFDELNRRMNEAVEVPFLPVRDHYHPKRNQARQKLATLSRPKFVDLVQDVNSEIKRRFPQQVVAKPPIPDHSRYPRNKRSTSGSNQTTSTFNSNYTSQNGGYDTSNVHHHRPSHGQFQSGRSPPVSGRSSGGKGNDTHDLSMYGENLHNSERFLDSVDKAANDLSHAIQTSHQGSMERIPTPDGRAARQPSSELEKLRNEYEMRLSAMRKRIGQLESQMLDYRMNESSETKADELNNLEKLNKILTQKNERFENENKVLRDQLMTVKADMATLRTENEKLERDKMNLIDHERQLKYDLEDARSRIRRYKTTSVFAKDHRDGDLEPPPKLVISEGAIRKTSVLGFQVAVDKLLLATRSETFDTDLPFAFNAVKRACNELRADVCAYESAHKMDSNRWPLPADVLHNGISDSIQSLDIMLVKLEKAITDHLDSMGVSPVSLLEAAASHLATSVVNLVKLLKVCRSDDRAPPRLPGDNISLLQQIDALKQNLEDRTDSIVDSIQNMLRIVRATDPDPTTLVSTLESIITLARSIIDSCKPAFSELKSSYDPSDYMGNSYDPAKASQVIEGLENGHLQLNDQLNDIGEAQEASDDNQLDNPIIRELLSDTVFKQRLTSAVFDVAKYTKVLMSLLEQ